MATKDFDAWLAEKAGRPQFTVGGQTFTARAKLPWKTFGKLLAAMSAPDADEYKQTEEFFRLTLIRADRDRFLELLEREDEDDEKVVSAEQVAAIVEYLMEHFTGKRPESGTGSSDGPEPTGPQPNVVSLNPRQTRTA